MSALTGLTTGELGARGATNEPDREPRPECRPELTADLKRYRTGSIRVSSIGVT